MTQAHRLLFLSFTFSAALLGAPEPRIIGSNQAHNNFAPCVLSEEQVEDTQTYPCLAIIRFHDDSSPDQRSGAIKESAAISRFQLGSGGDTAAIIPNAKSLTKIKESLFVKKIYPDNKIQAIAKKGSGGPTQTSQIVPEGVKRIAAAPGLLNVSGDGIGVAVVDTGVDLQHPDLSVSPGCFSAYSDCQDRNGHGTHVAGIIGAINNNIGVVGVAPASTIYAVKSLDDQGSGTDSSLIAGLNWVQENADSASPKIKVVNMSLGRFASADDSLLQAKIRELTDQGISVVVAAGNDSGFEISDMVPAGFPEVLAIASTTANSGSSSCRGFPYSIPANSASFFTTDGPGIAISAPGEESEDISRSCFISSQGILSLAPGGGTARMSGTSMASPHVAGVVALLQEKCPSLIPSAVRRVLQDGSDGNGLAPLDSPVRSYTFDGVREGVVSARNTVSTCP